MVRDEETWMHWYLLKYGWEITVITLRSSETLGFPEEALPVFLQERRPMHMK